MAFPEKGSWFVDSFVGKPFRTHKFVDAGWPFEVSRAPISVEYGSGGHQ